MQKNPKSGLWLGSPLHIFVATLFVRPFKGNFIDLIYVCL